MKFLKFGAAIIVVCLFSCYQTVQQNNSASNDKLQIRDLIRNVLNWSNSKNTINVHPALADAQNSTYIGFDMNELKKNLEKLKATNYFSSGFIDNYNQIILTLDKKIKNKKFEKWPVGELPPFSFANDSDPWCDCQDVPYDKPNPWSLVNIKIIILNNEKGDLLWTWGKLGADVSQDWRDFKYKFKVVKEDGRWKISYMEGFDYKESIR